MAWPGVPTMGVSVPDTKSIEERVTAAQNKAKAYADGLSELEKQALYQYLWADGSKIPSDLHTELRRLARKEGEK